jgi:flagellar L-ring protein precursor FlgH
MPNARPLRLPLVAVLASACVGHIAPYQPKHRNFDAGEYADSPRTRGASLYAGGPGLYEDDRAGRVGDVLVIVIDESDSATGGASTRLDKSSKSSYSTPVSLGLLPALAAKVPGLDPAALFSVDNQAQFDGKGQTKRSGRVSATLPVRVRKVLPNGDLYVEGTKVILVGHEESHLYLSGVVRRADVRADNTVLSSRIADAEIEYTGRGDVSDQQRPGWLSRFASWIWPF